MGRAKASLQVPGLASDAEALWYDPVRWAAWIDGFGHVVELPEDWPAGGRLVWNSLPDGRGRVAETVTRVRGRAAGRRSRRGRRLRGAQRVPFAPGPDAVTVTLALDYELKERAPLIVVIDLLFVRREVTASLRRTLARFARERRADTELGAVTSR